MAEVAGTLDRLRREEERLATRTSVVNLVVVSSDPAAVERTRCAMRRLGHHHPGRTLALVLQHDQHDNIDASVELHQVQAEGRTIWWEEVVLSVGGRLCQHLGSLVSPLLLHELPVVAWYPSELPPRDDPLVASAHALLVDARWAGEQEGGAHRAIPALVGLSRRRVVVDLSWKRLLPWRQLLAELFEPEPLRPFVEEVRSVEVTAHAGPAHLLAGWLMDRLGLPSAAIRLRATRHAAIRVVAQRRGQRATFTVARPTDARVVLARVDLAGALHTRRLANLPEHGLSWSLAEALSHLERDPVYEHSLHAALALG
jgi:glucose-6-phosphate dehydrogenase assembly protein OpcA